MDSTSAPVIPAPYRRGWRRTVMLCLSLLAVICSPASAAVSSNEFGVQTSNLPGQAVYQAPAGFPTSIFSTYWRKPVATAEPQPALYDPVLNKTFQLNLTDPNDTQIAQNNSDPLYFPKPIARVAKAQAQGIVDDAVRQIDGIITGSYISGNCSKCIASLAVAKGAAQLAPTLMPDAFVSLCKRYKFKSDENCEQTYRASSLGAVWTQVLSLADVTGLDGQYMCNSLSSSFCATPATSHLNTTGLFPKPKPANATAPKPSGKRVKVVHLSDFHLDPRYSVGAEANCSSNLCCRANNFNSKLPTGQISLASPLYGSFQCDAPYDLVLAALESVGPLTGTNETNPLAWALYTGDLAAHDPQWELSRATVEYAELSVYSLLRQYLKVPVFSALGNHDTNPVAVDAPHSLPGPLGTQLSWNYDHVAGLWKNFGWLDEAHARQARLHYGGYSVRNPAGLRIISFNGDFWYHSNPLNFINASDPDVSGTQRWIIDELQRAEDAGERVWLMAHVLSGWMGNDPMPNPTNMFYQIVERYSPHVIAAIFFGHTHEDQFTVFYANNGTAMDVGSALNIAWIGPSVTPLTNLNSGFRLYEVDSGSFDVMEAHTFFANVSEFSGLSGSRSNNNTGPTFRYEYSARDLYGPSIRRNVSAASNTSSSNSEFLPSSSDTATGWPADAPLNATFWHLVTEAMQRDGELVTLQNELQGKRSVLSPNCTNEACRAAKICYMRAGSVPLGRLCPQGYGSVQSPFTPK